MLLIRGKYVRRMLQTSRLQWRAIERWWRCRGWHWRMKMITFERILVLKAHSYVMMKRYDMWRSSHAEYVGCKQHEEVMFGGGLCGVFVRDVIVTYSRVKASIRVRSVRGSMRKMFYPWNRDAWFDKSIIIDRPKCLTLALNENREYEWEMCGRKMRCERWDFSGVTEIKWQCGRFGAKWVLFLLWLGNLLL